MTFHGQTPGAAAPLTSPVTPTTMRAVVQDAYGCAQTSCSSQRSPHRRSADDDVLVRVRAAGVHIGDWHVMTGSPYLMRVVGFGFRGPEGSGPGHGCRRNGRGGGRRT